MGRWIGTDPVVSLEPELEPELEPAAAACPVSVNGVPMNGTPTDKAADRATAQVTRLVRVRKTDMPKTLADSHPAVAGGFRRVMKA
ncbi:hypothetical protein [Gordonia paraffinivorans]|uniref:hypothetical protein n=1 Tax=Gordonia paraffinivorans TaxID=175628 RepID=UPI0028A05994|nr:hypothetical protein [Gordonia paraffinivorans]